MQINELGQPVGRPLPGWSSRLLPEAAVIEGRYCRLERLDPRRHADDLFEADRDDTRGESWTYLPYGPFADVAEYRRWVEAVSRDPALRMYAVVSADHDHRAVGVLSYLRMQPEVGVVEVGHVHYSPRLQRARSATEAQFLMASYVFDDLGYRRYEWKCDGLNAPSRAAAERLGFTYEGTFRQDHVVKGRNRDTAWYSTLDSEWPEIKRRYGDWLRPDNFDARGRQLGALAALGTN